MKIMTATIRPCTETENEYRLTESHEAEFGHEWDGNIKAYILNAAEDESATLEAMAREYTGRHPRFARWCNRARRRGRPPAGVLLGGGGVSSTGQGGRQGSRPLYPSIHTGSGQGGLLPGRPASGLRGLGRPEGLCHASVRR